MKTTAVVAIMPLEKLKFLKENDPCSNRKSISGLDLDPLFKPPPLKKKLHDTSLDIVWGGGGEANHRRIYSTLI